MDGDEDLPHKKKNVAQLPEQVFEGNVGQNDEILQQTEEVGHFDDDNETF